MKVSLPDPTEPPWLAALMWLVLHLTQEAFSFEAAVIIALAVLLSLQVEVARND